MTILLIRRKKQHRKISRCFKKHSTTKPANVYFLLRFDSAL